MLTRAQNAGSVASMSNVLGDTTRQQILALGRLGWTLSRIQQTTGVRRETVSGYLKAAGLPVRGRVRAPRHRDHLFHAIVITHSTAS